MTPPVVFAYLDPGTGSYLLQVAMGGLLAGLYAVKHFWSRLKGRFTRSGPAVHDERHG